MDHQAIIEWLKELDEALTNDLVTMELVVVGYSSLVLLQLENRGTMDIDLLETQPLKYFKKYSSLVQLLPEHYFSFHPSYRERLHELSQNFQSLNVFVLDPYDLALLKIDAARPKDLDDICDLIHHGHVELDRLESLFREWKTMRYPNDPTPEEFWQLIVERVNARG
jgi:hypothetical protein